MGFKGLRAFQSDHKKWLDHNFPGQTPHQGLLGLTEEVGELAHAHLKYEQSIRGYSNGDKYQHDAMDAVGDIMIYLASYCNSNGLSMADALEMAWNEVKDRDWQAYPETGRPADAEQPTGVKVMGPDEKVSG